MSNLTRKVKILGVDFSIINLGEAVNKLVNQAKGKKKTFVVTANTEIVMNGYNDKKYSEVLKRADLILPDGIGVVWASLSFIKTILLRGLLVLIYWCNFSLKLKREI
jgi:N-acetylglucosaminyldiphosphoundecaprenol N-acetyl-beta-D-mannosaminyltransferase